MGWLLLVGRCGSVAVLGVTLLCVRLSGIGGAMIVLQDRE